MRDTRPADVPALAALAARSDTHWFGAPESDEVELAESFRRIEHAVLVEEHGCAVAAAWWTGENTTLLRDPGRDDLLDGLLTWLRASGAAYVDSLDRDPVLLAALARHGWTHERSSYELVRSVEGWELATPAWPDGVVVTPLGDPAEVHALVHDDADWTAVPGHVRREPAEWTSLFLGERVPVEHQVLARRDGRLVGAALCRTFPDGTGWVSQLAVAVPERGRGLGRALLLEGLRRQVAAGATQLGLMVSATNGGALGLYLSVGLRIDREWQHHRPG